MPEQSDVAQRTEVRPIPPSPPIPPGLGRGDATRSSSSAAFRALKGHVDSPSNRLGGAARRSGAAAQLVSSGKALNDEGAWRPSIWLRMVIDPADYKSSMSNDEEHLVAWMAKELEGAQIKLGPGSRPGPAATKEKKPTHQEAAEDIVEQDVKRPLISLKKEFASALKKFDKEGAEVEIRPEFKGEFENPLSQVEVCEIFKDLLGLQVSEVKEHLQKVVEHIPFLGALLGVVKSLKISGDMVMTTLEKMSVHKQIHSSISVIEERSLTAVLTYQNAALVKDGVNLGSTLVGTAASATGTTHFTAVPLAALNMIHKVILLIRESMSASTANQKLRDGALDIEILSDAPLLGLLLPHLPSADPFAMLGIAPPGWQDNESAQHVISKVKTAAQKPENEWFLKSFSGEGVTKDTVPEVWKQDFEKMENMLSKMNKYLYDERWGVYKNNVLMHKAAPQTWGQKIRQEASDAKQQVIDFVKEKALLLLEKIKSILGISTESQETTGDETPPTGQVKITRPTLPGQPMVEADLKLEDMDDEENQ